MIQRISIVLFAVSSFSVAFGQNDRQESLQIFTDQVFNLSEVMLHDVANPPAASRFYAYALLGAYEAAYLGTPTPRDRLPEIDQKLRIVPSMKAPVAPKSFDLTFCSVYTMLQVGKQIMPSGIMLEENKKHW